MTELTHHFNQPLKTASFLEPNSTQTTAEVVVYHSTQTDAEIMSKCRKVADHKSQKT